DQRRGPQPGETFEALFLQVGCLAKPVETLNGAESLGHVTDDDDDVLVELCHRVRGDDIAERALADAWNADEVHKTVDDETVGAFELLGPLLPYKELHGLEATCPVF